MSNFPWETRTPATPCPACGALLDAASHVRLERVSPSPDDPTVCAECLSLLVFQHELGALPADIRLELTTIRDRLRSAIHGGLQ